jgi:hypothetical protein
MPGKTIGTYMHGPTETVLSATIEIEKQDGRYSLAKFMVLAPHPIEGPSTAAVELRKFLEAMVNKLNGG